jgi:hypothetical protein
MHYDGARASPDRHATYIVAAYFADAARRPCRGRRRERSHRAAPPGPKARRCRDGRAKHRSGRAVTQCEDDGVTGNEAVTADMDAVILLGLLGGSSILGVLRAAGVRIGRGPRAAAILVRFVSTRGALRPGAV